MKRIGFALEALAEGEETPAVPEAAPETPAVAAEVPAEVFPEQPAEPAPLDHEEDGEVPADEDTGELEEDGIANIIAADNLDNEAISAIEDTGAALEAISMYASNLEYLIANKSYSAESLDLINFGVQQQFNRLNMKLPAVSLESNISLEEQYAAALEGLREAWNRIAQSFDLMFEHTRAARQEIFSSSTRMVAANRKELTELQTKLDGKKDGLKDAQHSGSLVQLWQFFTTDHGQVSDIVGATGKDVELSKYLLTKYPTEILGLYSKLVGVVRGGKVDSLKAAVAFAKRIELMPHPAALFNTHYVTNGKPYLGVVGIEKTIGTARNPIHIGDNTFIKLAELATAHSFVEVESMKHAFKQLVHGAMVQGGGDVVAGKVGARAGLHLAFKHGLHAAAIGGAVAGTVAGVVAGGVAGAAIGHGIEMTTAEINQLMKYSGKYLDNIDVFLGTCKKVDQAAENLKMAMKHLVANVPEDLPKEEASQIKQLMKQVEQYFFNLHVCFNHPAVDELRRSFRGSKYTRLLAYRMVKQAK